MANELSINTQKAWGGKVAAYLFLAGSGAGAYLAAFAAALLKPEWTAVIRTGGLLSLVLLAAGILFLLFDLGKKQLAPLAFSRPGRSWISRGTVFIAVFMLFDFIFMLTVWSIPGPEPGLKSWLIPGAVAAAAALLVLTYTGMVLGAARPVELWNPAFLVVLFLVSGISSGIACIVCCSVYGLFPGQATGSVLQSLAGINAFILTAEAAVISLFLTIMSRRATARGSVRLIIRGKLSPLFWGVVAAGMAISLAFDYYAGYTSSFHFHAAAIAASLLGLSSGFMLRYVIILSGAAAPLNVQGRLISPPPLLRRELYIHEDRQD
jgi:polysulfide reductase chain C